MSGFDGSGGFDLSHDFEVDAVGGLPNSHILSDRIMDNFNDVSDALIELQRGTAPLGVANVASAATVNLGATLSAEVCITGSTTITSFGTAAAGIYREGYFSGPAMLTNNNTSLQLPGAANITPAVNDRFGALSLGSGNWIVLWYTIALATPALAARSGFRGVPGTNQTISSNTLTKVVFNGVVGGGATYNVGSNFDATNSKWTPPAGACMLTATIDITGTASTDIITLYIYKNGAALCAQRWESPSSAWNSFNITVTDNAAGTDYYEIYIINPSRSMTVQAPGTPNSCFFSGLAP